MIDDLLVDARARGASVDDGLQVLPWSALVRRPFDPGWPLLLVPDGVMERAATGDADRGRPPYLPAVLPGRAAAGPDPVRMLQRLYPGDHPVLGLAGARDGTVATLGDDAVGIGALLLPALLDEANDASPHGLPWLVARLRAPDGCPWDREQDHRSLKKFLLEEAYEVYDALEEGSTPELAEELGDLLLQVVLHAQFAAEAGVFDLRDVYREVVTKIVRRHPHVFGDVVADTADEVVRNWESIKAGERAAGAAGRTGDGRGKRARREGPAAFSGLSRSLPALVESQEMQERAAGLGYDWPDVEGVIGKLEEEAVELLGADTADARREEFGDLLFVIVNLGRKLALDAEASLRAANAKFASRFARVERLAETRGRALRDLPFEVLDELWQEAKAEERAEASTPAVAG